MSDLPKTIWAWPMSKHTDCGNWTEGTNARFEMERKQEMGTTEYTRTDTVEGMKSTLSTAMKLLRDNQSIMHFSREITTADDDVLRAARSWK